RLVTVDEIDVDLRGTPCAEPWQQVAVEPPGIVRARPLLPLVFVLCVPGGREGLERPSGRFSRCALPLALRAFGLRDAPMVPARVRFRQPRLTLREALAFIRLGQGAERLGPAAVDEHVGALTAALTRAILDVASIHAGMLLDPLELALRHHALAS